MLRIQYHCGMPLNVCDLTGFNLEFDVPGHFQPELPVSGRKGACGRANLYFESEGDDSNA